MDQSDLQTARVPARTVLVSIAGIWLAYLALITLRSALIDRTYFGEMLALRTVVALAGHEMAETDMELGANLMVFFCRDWAELQRGCCAQPGGGEMPDPALHPSKCSLAILSRHTNGASWWTLLPSLSTATVTGISSTVNS